MVRKLPLSIKTIENRCPGIVKIKRDLNIAIIIADDIDWESKNSCNQVHFFSLLKNFSILSSHIICWKNRHKMLFF